jgi:hypothetical protein
MVASSNAEVGMASVVMLAAFYYTVPIVITGISTIRGNGGLPLEKAT